MYTAPQLAGWKLVTDRVHAKGGFLFAQLMHAGRITHSSLLPEGQLPLAPSAVRPEGLVHGAHGKVGQTDRSASPGPHVSGLRKVPP
jgi:N-ethylmaleimide reductase